MNKILSDNILASQVSTPKETIVNVIAEQLSQMARQSFNSMVYTQRRGIDMVWDNPKVTPQEIFDILGDQGGKICNFHAALTQMIYAMAQLDGIQVDLKFPTHVMTVEDGVVTVTDTPYVAPF